MGIRGLRPRLCDSKPTLPVSVVLAVFILRCQEVIKKIRKARFLTLRCSDLSVGSQQSHVEHEVLVPEECPRQEGDMCLLLAKAFRKWPVKPRVSCQFADTISQHSSLVRSAHGPRRAFSLNSE